MDRGIPRRFAVGPRLAFHRFPNVAAHHRGHAAIPGTPGIGLVVDNQWLNHGRFPPARSIDLGCDNLSQGHAERVPMIFQGFSKSLSFMFYNIKIENAHAYARRGTQMTLREDLRYSIHSGRSRKHSRAPTGLRPGVARPFAGRSPTPGRLLVAPQETLHDLRPGSQQCEPPHCTPVCSPTQTRLLIALRGKGKKRECRGESLGVSLPYGRTECAALRAGTDGVCPEDGTRTSSRELLTGLKKVSAFDLETPNECQRQRIDQPSWPAETGHEVIHISQTRRGPQKRPKDRCLGLFRPESGIRQGDPPKLRSPTFVPR